MKKGKSITLLSIIGFIMAFLIVMTFVPFSIGVKNYESVVGAIELDYDIAGGYAYTLTLSSDNVEEIDDVNEVINTIEYRLDALGYKTHAVKAFRGENNQFDDYELRIELRGETNEYGKQDVEAITSDVQVAITYGQLRFFGDSHENPDEDNEILTAGKVIANAKYSGATTGADGSTVYQITVTFTDYAYTELMNKFSGEEEEGHEGHDHGESYYLKIMLGDEELLSGSNALSKDYFNGKSITITSTSEEMAIRNALLISSGGLAYQFDEPSDPVKITSLYGSDIAKKLLISIAVSFAVVLVAFFVMYRGLGLAFNLSSILFVLIELSMLIAIPGIKLSLGGVIGIVLAMILTFFAQVVLAKRIKDEFASGKTVKSAINTALRTTLIPQIGMYVLAGVIGLLSFLFASGTFTCFGITLGIGAVVAAVCNLLFIRMFISLIFPLAKYSEKFLALKNVQNKEAI